MFCVHVFLYICVPGTREAQKVSDPLVLELQMIVNYCVGAENQINILWGTSALNHQPISSVPINKHFKTNI